MVEKIANVVDLSIPELPELENPCQDTLGIS
jgi:hypothetical protein